MSHASLLEQYRRVTARRRAALAALAGLALASFALDLATGPAALTLDQIVRGLADPASLERAMRIVLWDVRLPDSLMAVVVGAALGIAGTEIQTILNNPLASPFTLGISSAAALGAALAIALGLNVHFAGYPVAVPMLAFACAVTAGALILMLTQVFAGSAASIVLFGIALLFFCDAMTAVLQFISSDEAVREIVFWRLGDLTKAGWPEVVLVGLCVLAVLPLSLRASAALTVLRGGEEMAQGAGLALRNVRRACIVRVSFLTAMSVAFVGAISFIGLVGPHIARLLLGEDHRFLIPGAAITGALLLSLASYASKAAIPGIIVPVGIATSLVGIPFFVLLLFSRRRTLS